MLKQVEQVNFLPELGVSEKKLYNLVAQALRDSRLYQPSQPTEDEITDFCTEFKSLFQRAKTSLPLNFIEAVNFDENTICEILADTMERIKLLELSAPFAQSDKKSYANTLYTFIMDKLAENADHQKIQFERAVFNKLTRLSEAKPSMEPSWNFAAGVASLIEQTAKGHCKRNGLVYKSEHFNELLNKYVENKIQQVPLKAFDLLKPAAEQSLIDKACEAFYEPKLRYKQKNNLENFFINQFEALDECFYILPDTQTKQWLKAQNLAQTTRIAKRLSPEVKANLELKQRAMSFIHAVFIMAKGMDNNYHKEDICDDTLKKFQNLQKRLIRIYQNFQLSVDKAGESLTNKGYYEHFLKTELSETFINQLKDLMVSDFGMDFGHAGKVLHQFECIANWERQADTQVGQQGFATVTKAAKGHQIINISQTVNCALTNEQKEEIKRINSDNKPAWFTELPVETQSWLQLKAEKIISGELPSPPSVLRFIPTLANVRNDITLMADDHGKVYFRTEATRGAVPSAVGVKNATERARLTRQNTKQLKQLFSNYKDDFNIYWGDDNQKCLNDFQPFVLGVRYLSPGWYDRSRFTRSFMGSDNNHLMLEEYRKVNGSHFIDTFIPVNAVRKQADNLFKDESNKEARRRFHLIAKVLLEKVTSPSLNVLKSNYDSKAGFSADNLATINQTITGKEWFSDNVKANKVKVAFRALQVYQQIWEDYANKSSIDNPNGLNIELILAACQALVAEGFGLKVFHGCKSAKDRLAALEMQKTAMARFLLSEGVTTFNYTDSKHVQTLSDYFADAFLSGYHQHVVSTYSSYGSHAIQDGKGFTPNSYAQMVPKSYQIAIGKKLLEDKDGDKKDERYLQAGKDYIANENAMGKTASLGKSKSGFKKFLSWLTNIFSSKPKHFDNVGVSRLNVGLLEGDGSDLTIPSKSELRDSSSEVTVQFHAEDNSRKSQSDVSEPIPVKPPKNQISMGEPLRSPTVFHQCGYGVSKEFKERETNPLVTHGLA